MHNNIDWYQQINPFASASKLGPMPLEAIITDHHWWYMHLNECSFTKAMTAKVADAEASWIGPLQHRQGPSQPLRLLQLQILFHCPYLTQHHYPEPHDGRPDQCRAMACTFDNWQAGTIRWALAGCMISVFGTCPPLLITMTQVLQQGLISDHQIGYLAVVLSLYPTIP